MVIMLTKFCEIISHNFFRECAKADASTYFFYRTALNTSDYIADDNAQEDFQIDFTVSQSEVGSDWLKASIWKPVSDYSHTNDDYYLICLVLFIFDDLQGLFYTSFRSIIEILRNFKFEFWNFSGWSHVFSRAPRLGVKSKVDGPKVQKWTVISQTGRPKKAESGRS